MSTGKIINALPAADEVAGDMLIPTGGFGDRAITVDQLKTFVESYYKPYLTNNPNIKAKNGKLQKLTLFNSGKLTSDLQSGMYVFLKISGSYILDISDFKNINNFVRDSRFESTILIFNFLGERLLMGMNHTVNEVHNNSGINCEGAENNATWFAAIKDGEEQIPSDLVFVIDGVEFNQYPEWLSSSVVPINMDAPQGYTWVTDRVILENTDSIDHKISITMNRPELFKIFVQDNSSTVEIQNGFGFCLTAGNPTTGNDLYFSGVRFNNGQLVFSLYSETEDENVTFDVVIKDPNNTPTHYNLTSTGAETNYTLNILYSEGFYTLHYNFKDIITDVHYKASENDQTVPKPTITSVTRNSFDTVTIQGTCKKFSVIRLIQQNNDNDDPIAYFPIPDGVNEFVPFSLTIDLPQNFSGYLRCQDGNYASSGAKFTI